MKNVFLILFFFMVAMVTISCEPERLSELSNDQSIDKEEVEIPSDKEDN